MPPAETRVEAIRNMPNQRIAKAVDDQRDHDGEAHQLRRQAKQLIVENQQQEVEAIVLDAVRNGAKAVQQLGSNTDRAQRHGRFFTTYRRIVVLVYIPSSALPWDSILRSPQRSFARISSLA